ncbi:MAG: 2,3-bisphosphoglycerate-independent phosphoglycerate mutase [Halobacteriales archaeon]
MTQAALVILDGWGEREETDGNAVANADTPNYDRWSEEGATSSLRTYGRSVGLVEGQMGNSEVGHLNIGAGRIVKQPLARIDDGVEEGSFFDNDVLINAVESGDRFHLMGLVSDGGVHSAQRHLHALLELADESGRGDDVVVHAFLDGRDTPPQSAVGYLRKLVDKADETGATVATVTGRYYAMDRDENWERTRAAYDAIVCRKGRHAENPVEAVEDAYDRGDTDEFVEPTVIDDAPALCDGDSVFFFNFRGDRARQLTRMINGIEPEWEGADGAETALDVEFATMTAYDEEYDIPVAYPAEQPANVLGSVLADAGLTQFRIAETEKYAHVTYFLNGGREREFEGEKREIVPSPDVPTYDEKPEMSAYEVTERAVEAVGDHDVIVVNYANPDMVGHTGDYDAAVEACEAVDECAGRLVDALRDEDAEVIVTADHGNAEKMGTPEDPHTAHTFNDAPFIHVEGDVNAKDGELRDIAPTLLELLGVDTPDEMTGEPLV